MKQKFLYIHGDSWTSLPFINPYIDSMSTKYKNIFVINKSVAGSGNLEIIKRTISDLEILDSCGIRPSVCISLSEVGRNPIDEFSLVPPNTDSISLYLEQVLQAEIEMLTKHLKKYNYYITSGWVPNNKITNKGIIDFIDIKLDDINVYSISNGIYSWITDRQKVFKFNKESILEALSMRDEWVSRLQSNYYVDQTLHVELIKSSKLYENWLVHVLKSLNLI